MQERRVRAREFVRRHSAESQSRAQEVFERLGLVGALNDVKEFWGEGEVDKSPDGTGLVIVSDPFKRLTVERFGISGVPIELEIKLDTMYVGISFVDKDHNNPLPKAKQKLKIYYQRFPLFRMDGQVNQVELNSLNAGELIGKLSKLTKGGIMIESADTKGELGVSNIDFPDAADKFNKALVDIVDDDFIPERFRQQQQQIIDQLPPLLKQRLMIPFSDDPVKAKSEWLSAAAEQSALMEARQIPPSRRFFGLDKGK